MKYLKRFNIFILCLIMTVLYFSLDVKADAGEERTVYLSATEYDYPPFSVTDSGEADGFSVELLKAVAEEMGIVVTFKIDQWTVLKEELKNGELDILPLVGYTEERDEVYDFTVPYIVMRGNIFVRKDDDRIQSQEDLFGKEILVLDGDNSQEWAWSIGLDSELTATSTYLEAFQLLDSGQYDAVLAQGLVGEKLISDNGLDNISPVYIYDDNGINRYKLNLEGYEQKFCFAVVEGDTALLSLLNEGLSIVSANGTYDALYQKWFPFLLENNGVSTAEVLKYVGYALIPIFVLFISGYFITTRRTIRIITKEIMTEKERSEKFLHDLILSGKIFETSIENAPIPIMIHAEDGEVLNISRTWTKLTGYNKDDIPTIYDWTEKAYHAKKDDVRNFISKLYTLTEVQHDGIFEVITQDDRKLAWDFHSMHIGDLPDGRAVVMSVATDITERVQMDKQLKESEQRFKILHNASFGGITVHDKGLILDCNQGLSDITGFSIDELIGMDGLLLIAPDYRAFVMDKINSGYEKPYEAYGIRKNKEIYPLHLEARNIPYEGKQVRVVEFRDITDRKKLESDVIKEKESLAFTLKSIGDAVIATDASGIITAINPIACKLTGWSETEAMNKPFNEVFNITFEDKSIPVEDPVQKALTTNSIIELANHTILISKDKTEYFIEDTAAPIKNAQGENIGVVLVFRDVTDKKKAEREIRHISEHDYLTDLHNRRYYFERLDYFHQEEFYPLGLMMLDVNGLKIINDAFGHHQGDQALIMIGSVLNETFEDKDVISRIGGDEFTVILPNTSAKALQSYKEKLISVMKNKRINNVELSLSIGYELIKNKNDDLDEIQKMAENHMYSHKSLFGSSIRSGAINAILLTLTDKYDSEKRHSVEVSQLCRKMGIELKLKQDELKGLEQAGLFHDIGKISIPDSILNKPGKLTDEEFEIIKSHTQIGYQILRAADEYSDLALHALHHHERWDGKGYPSGLKEDSIPLFSRIINIVDAYEAMTADRPYRKKLSKAYAVSEIIRCAGTQFDPKLAKVFVESVLKEKWEII